MSESISGGISFNGLGSGGLDYEAMIKQEKSIKEIPSKRLTAWQADWQKRYEAFDKLYTSIQTLSNKLSAMSSSSDFLKKNVASSSSGVATAKGSSKASNGTNSIDVKQLATNAVLTNNHVFASKSVNVTGGATPPVFAYDYKGTTYTLQIPENCELDYLVTKINGDQKNPGVTAALIKTGNGYIFQLSGKDTGEGSDLKINAATNLPAFSASPTSVSNSLASPTALVNGSGATQYFSFTNNSTGKSYSLAIPSGTTAQQFVDGINSQATGKDGTGVRASLVPDGSGQYNVQLESLGGGSVSVIPTPPLTNEDGTTTTFTDLSLTWTSTASSYTRTISGGVDPADTVINKAAVSDPPNPADNYIFSFNDKNGNKVDIAVEAGNTLSDLVKKVNEQRGTTGVKASLATQDGKVVVQMERDDGQPVTGMSMTLSNGTTPVPAGASAAADALTGAWRASSSSQEGWSKRESQDAIYTVNDLAMDFTSSSNTLTEVFAGLEVTLLSTGKTTLTTTTSTEDTKKKIEEFIEAFNEVLKEFDAVNKYDEDKNVKTRAATKDADGNYVIDYSSQFSYQKGGVLTGNYGVQMIESQLKQMITGRGAGFTPKETKTDASGDLFTSLSSIGIIMDSDEASATFGQLRQMTKEERIEKGKVDDPIQNPYRTLDMALEEDAEAVVDLFVGNGGKTDNDAFSYRGSIGALSTAPTPGEYAVEYTVSSAGTPPDFITVGGVTVPRDGETGTYVVPSGPIAGVEISVDSLNVGTVSGNIRIKQGKIPQLAGQLKDELRNDPLTKDAQGNIVYNPDQQRGALVVLKENYQTIMNNIQKKLDEETKRLQSWEKRERLRFSRLDTLLGNYQNLMSSNASALAGASE